MFLFVSVDLSLIAFAIVLLSKWRVLAVKSRYWAINFRSNMVDVFLGLSVVEFMSQMDNIYGRLSWLSFYVLWVLYIKKLSNTQGMIMQAVLAQGLAISAILYNNQSISLGFLTFATWFVSYFAARHALSSFDEDHAPALGHAWALFAVQLAWVLGHWHIWFWFIHQIVLILSILYISLALIYVLYKQKI